MSNQEKQPAKPNKRKRAGHGEGSVYQRKDGRWVGEITLEDGSRKPYYGKTRKEAYEKKEKALQEQKQGILATGPQQKLKDYLEQWLENVDKPFIRESTYVKHHSLLKNHILPALGHIQLQRLTAQDVQSFYARKLKEKLSPGMILSMHGVLHKALKKAVQWKLVSQNVCDAIELPSRIRYEGQPLTKEQAQKLLEAARGHRLEVLLTVAVTTGMRQGELLSLRWKDINFQSTSVYVHRTVLPIPGRGYVENEPKTAGSRRRIKLPQFVFEMLKQHRSRLEEMRVKAGDAWTENDLVFPNIYGRFIDKGNFYRVFQKLLKEADVPRVRFHDLRHSAATILYQPAF
jgi:integrase